MSTQVPIYMCALNEEHFAIHQSELTHVVYDCSTV